MSDHQDVAIGGSVPTDPHLRDLAKSILCLWVDAGESQKGSSRPCEHCLASPLKQTKKACDVDLIANRRPRYGLTAIL